MEATKFASLWATKDTAHIMETNIFLVLFKMELRTVISQLPQLLPTLHAQYTNIVDFREDF